VQNVEQPWTEGGGHLPALIDGQMLVPEGMIVPYLLKTYPELDIDSKLPGGKKAEVRKDMPLWPIRGASYTPLAHARPPHPCRAVHLALIDAHHHPPL
jgi:hypothetical protein